MEYNDRDVAEILKVYQDVLQANQKLSEAMYQGDIKRRSAAEDLQRILGRFKPLTSMKLREMLPINLECIEKLCIRAITPD